MGRQLIAHIVLRRAKSALHKAQMYYQFYPPGSFGWAKGDLWFEIADMWHQIAKALLGEEG